MTIDGARDMKQVDSFAYTSGLISRYYKLIQVTKVLPVPWTPLSKPLEQCRFGLVTTGGLYNKVLNEPFDLEREKMEPCWGDPSFRALSADIDQAEVGVAHLHINATSILEDMNVLLPVQRFQELVRLGRVGSLAAHAYSFMGYQGIPADTCGWRDESGPQVAERMKEEGVDCVFVTTA